MKKMNKTYIITALGVLGSPLLTTNANADLFKCVACTNKPANSSYTTSGNGGNNCSWSCNSGYTKRGNNCCASAPANATLNANDCGWSCNSGYTKKGSTCCANAPSNATLNANDCGWSCNSGYTKKGSTCCANAPTNATLNANDCGWSCNSGYTRKGNSCCANAPANATLNANDCGWSCNSGYSKNTAGTGCELNCNSGYYANNGKCELCPAGSYCTGGVKNACSVGTYSYSGASSCTSCPDGQYQNETGKSSCKDCTGNYTITETCNLARYYNRKGGCDDGKPYISETTTKNISFGDTYSGYLKCTYDRLYTEKNITRDSTVDKSTFNYYDFVKISHTATLSIKPDVNIFSFLGNTINDEYRNGGFGGCSLKVKLNCDKTNGSTNGMTISYSIDTSILKCPSDYTASGSSCILNKSF